MAFRVQQIDPCRVFVRDIDAAIRWYSETLELQEFVRWKLEPVMTGSGGTMLALFQAKQDSANRSTGKETAPGWHRVAWRTDRQGFEQAQEHLSRLRIRFRGPIDHGRSHSIYFEDPDGNFVEITHNLE